MCSVNAGWEADLMTMLLPLTRPALHRADPKTVRKEGRERGQGNLLPWGARRNGVPGWPPPLQAPGRWRRSRCRHPAAAVPSFPRTSASRRSKSQKSEKPQCCYTSGKRAVIANTLAVLCNCSLSALTPVRTGVLSSPCSAALTGPSGPDPGLGGGVTHPQSHQLTEHRLSNRGEVT